MALAIRNVDSADLGLSSWNSAEMKTKYFCSLEKVAKEVGVEHISAGMFVRAF